MEQQKITPQDLVLRMQRMILDIGDAMAQMNAIIREQAEKIEELEKNKGE